MLYGDGEKAARCGDAFQNDRGNGLKVCWILFEKCLSLKVYFLPRQEGSQEQLLVPSHHWFYPSLNVRVGYCSESLSLPAFLR